MDAQRRSQELLDEVEELIHAEVQERIALILGYRRGAAPVLDGKTYGDASFPIGILRSEIRTKLAHAYNTVATYRWVDAAHLRAAMLGANKFLTSCLDGIEGWPGGLKLRSAYVGKTEVAQAWITQMNEQIADAIKEMEGRDTIRPSAPPRDEGR